MTAPPALYLHVGCGEQHLDGWINIDRQELPGVDLVADVTRGLPFTGAEALYAEHFLEHLPLDFALAFLREAHRVLTPGGWLRLSTPNLDWVVATQYTERAAEGEVAPAALRLNVGFHGWSHRFLWNRALLAEVLEAVGFERLRWCRWGESEHPLLRGLERHDVYVESAELPHVLIVEARRGEGRPQRLAALRRLLESEFLAFARPLGWRIDPARSALVAHLRLRGVLGRYVREHVFRGAWVGGSVHFPPEAPEEAAVVVGIGTQHVRIDEPHMRFLAGVPRLPRLLRHRLEAMLLGPAWLANERWPNIELRSTAVSRQPSGALTVHGELSVHGVVTSLAVDVEDRFEDGVWRARGQVVVQLSTVGLPRWRFAGGLLRDDDRLVVDFDLVATPVLAT